MAELKRYAMMEPDVIGECPDGEWVKFSEAMLVIELYARKAVDALRHANELDRDLHEALAGRKLGGIDADDLL